MKSSSYRKPFTLKEVNWSSVMARRGVESFLKRHKELTTDAKKAQRVARRQCKDCFYLRGGVAGQAFTDYNCAACGKESSWPNTHVPQLCDECSDKHDLCQYCIGDREMKDRKELDADGTPPAR